MSIINPDDLFAVNRNDVTYSVEQQNLMASLENTDYLAVNRDDVTYKITGQEFIESVVDPLEISPTVSSQEESEGIVATVQENAFGGKQPFSYTYQWNYKVTDSSAPIDFVGATSKTFLIPTDYHTYGVGCLVNVTDGLGTTASGQSNYIKVAQPPRILSVTLTENNDGVERPLTTDEITGVSGPVIYSSSCTWTPVNVDAVAAYAFDGSSVFEMPGWCITQQTTGTFTPATPIAGSKLKVYIENASQLNSIKVNGTEVKDGSITGSNWFEFNLASGSLTSFEFTRAADTGGNSPFIMGFEIDGIRLVDNSTTLTLADDKDLTFLAAGMNVKQDNSPLELETSAITAVNDSPSPVGYGRVLQLKDNLNPTYQAYFELSVIDPIAIYAVSDGNWNSFTFEGSIAGGISDLAFAIFGSNSINGPYQRFSSAAIGSTQNLDEPTTGFRYIAFGAYNVSAAQSDGSLVFTLNARSQPVKRGVELTFTDDTDLAKFEPGDVVQDGELAIGAEYNTVAGDAGPDRNYGMLFPDGYKGDIPLQNCEFQVTLTGKNKARYLGLSMIFGNQPGTFARPTNVVTITQVNGETKNISCTSAWVSSTDKPGYACTTADLGEIMEVETFRVTVFNNNINISGNWVGHGFLLSEDNPSVSVKILDPSTAVNVISVDAGNNQMTVDGGDWKVWNESQTWSSDLAGTFDAGHPASLAFDGADNTYADCVASKSGWLLDLTGTTFGSGLHTIEVKSGGTAVTVNGSINLTTTDPSGAKTYTGTVTGEINSIESPVASSSVYYFKIDGQILVDAVNDSQVWSKGVSTDTSYNPGNPPQDAFDGLTNTSCGVVYSGNDSTDGFTVTFNPPLTGDVEIGMYSASGARYYSANGAARTQIPTDQGYITVDVGDFGSTPLSTLKLTSSAGQGSGLYFVRNDGILLVDTGIGPDSTVSMTKPITGVVGSWDAAGRTIALSESNGPWSANTGNYVVGPELSFSDGPRFTNQSFNVNTRNRSTSSTPITYSVKPIVKAQLLQDAQTDSITDVVVADNSQIAYVEYFSTGGAGYLSNVAVDNSSYTDSNPAQSLQAWDGSGSMSNPDHAFDGDQNQTAVLGASTTREVDGVNYICYRWTPTDPVSPAVNVIFTAYAASNKADGLNFCMTTYVDGRTSIAVDNLSVYGGPFNFEMPVQPPLTQLTFASDRDLQYLSVGNSMTQVANQTPETSAITGVEDGIYSELPNVVRTSTLSPSAYPQTPENRANSFDGGTAKAWEIDNIAGTAWGEIVFNPPIPINSSLRVFTTNSFDSQGNTYRVSYQVNDGATYSIPVKGAADPNEWHTPDVIPSELTSLKVTTVSGSSGWGASWARAIEVDGVILENGFVTLTLTDDTNLKNFRTNDETQKSKGGSEPYVLPNPISITPPLMGDVTPVFNNSGPGYIRPAGEQYGLRFNTTIEVVVDDVVTFKTVGRTNNPWTFQTINDTTGEVKTYTGSFASEIGWGGACTEGQTHTVNIAASGRIYKYFVSNGGTGSDAGICWFALNGDKIYNGSTITKPAAIPVNVASVDPSRNQIHVDGGTWSEGDTVRLPNNSVLAAEGIINSLDEAGQTITLSSSTGRWLVTEADYQENRKINASAKANTKVIKEATLYPVIDSEGNVSDLSETDRGYKLMVTGSSTEEDATIRFPSLLPSGETPDTALPAGTAIAADVLCANSVGQDEAAHGLTGAELVPVDTEAPENQFVPALYTGNGGSQVVDVGLPVDLVWLKGRNNATNHGLFDTVRGAGKGLYSDLPDAEFNVPETLSSFNSVGFTLGNNLTFNGSDDYVAWCWKSGDTTVTDNSGQGFTVQRRTGNGLSIIRWTGTGDTASIPHGLEAVPQMIITKRLDESAQWYSRHIALSADEYINLNQTDGKQQSAMWDNKLPNESFIFVSGGADSAALNSPGKEYIAYVWAKTATSDFGTYIGNGNLVGADVVCDFEPVYVIIKKLSGGGSWQILDRPRDDGGRNLSCDNANAEDTYTSVDFKSTGFNTTSAHPSINELGATYMYCAFAGSPTTFDARDAADVAKYETIETKLNAYPDARDNFRSGVRNSILASNLSPTEKAYLFSETIE